MHLSTARPKLLPFLRLSMYRLVSLLAVAALAWPPGTAVQAADPRPPKPGVAAVQAQAASETPTAPGKLTPAPILTGTGASPTVELLLAGTATVLTATPTADTTLIATPTLTATLEPTFTASATGTPTATPELTLTLVPTATHMPAVTPDLTPTATPTWTPTPNLTLTLTPTATAPLAPLLVFSFTVAPDQAAPGDMVTYTVAITNTGAVTATHVVFSDTLPEEFRADKNDSPGFAFDRKSGLLTSEAVALAPGGQVTLTYIIRLKPNTDEGQIVDSALVRADELQHPLEAEAALTILPRPTQLSRPDQTTRRAAALDNRVQVKWPAGLAAANVLLVQDLSVDAVPSSSPWLAFKLELRTEVADSLSPGLAAPSGALPGPAVVEHDRRTRLMPAPAEFDAPAELTVSFDGLADLAMPDASLSPFIVTQDEDSGTWVRLPLDAIDRAANTVTVKTKHFSTWGAGLGPNTPRDGTGMLLFDSAQPDLYIGAARFSIPIWTPPGRDGLAPNLALHYSSATADGLLGDIQAPWVGMGWNVDAAEIVRKITDGPCSPCGNGSYGYKNEYILTFNGAGGKLIDDGTGTGRYHTKDESFLYIQYHSTGAANVGGEWWEVVTRDGTHWRFGTTPDSEQLAAMLGYPGAATGAWAALGYAGHAQNVVAARWRVSQVIDTHNNRMSYGYTQDTRAVNGASPAINYDRASYLQAITYTEYLTPTLAGAYVVNFVLESRESDEIPVPQYNWENWDTQRLKYIQVKAAGSVIRQYALTYDVRHYIEDSQTWQRTVLSSVAVSGTVNGQTSLAPTVNFTYADFYNRGDGDPRWAYPRLTSIANGWGGTATLTYENDGRATSDTWYSYRVAGLALSDGVSASPMRTAFAYARPCYNDENAQGWCNYAHVGELTGYGQTTVTTQNFDRSALAVAVHQFHTDEPRSGREWETQNQDPNGTVLSQMDTTYVVAPTTKAYYFVYPSQTDTFVQTGSQLMRVSRTASTYDPATGNLTQQDELDGATLARYRYTLYEYQTNTNYPVWMLDRLSHKTVRADGVTDPLSEQWFGYDGNSPGAGTVITGDLTLAQVVSTTLGTSQTLDTAYVYDVYGNRTETRVYLDPGSPRATPSITAAYRSARTGYDPVQYTYALTATNPLSQSTFTGYDYALGVLVTTTDANGNQTLTAYDGLGRPTSMTYPGYTATQPNVQYFYPVVTGGAVSAPFSMTLQVLDETADHTSTYRQAWTISDGLGRVLQTQGPYTDTLGHNLIVADTAYDARGKVLYTGLPRAQQASGGTLLPQDWGAIPHSTASYDALGRPVSQVFPDGSAVTSSYDGLRTSTIDQNHHQKVQENDLWGRLAKVEEYDGTGPYTLYAPTTYQYNQRDQLTLVTDAKGNQTSLAYDPLGRKIGMTDPDMGTWSYGYDLFGNLQSQTDALAQTLTFDYDSLNRLKHKYQSGNPQPLATFNYDDGPNGVGQRTSMTDGTGSTTWAYNAFGKVISETHTISGTAYNLQATYDAFGRMLTQTYPGGEVVTATYNAMGAQIGLTSSLNNRLAYVSGVQYNVAGQVTSALLGDDVQTLNTLDALTGRLTLALSGKVPQNPVLQFDYSYDATGNVTQINDVTRSELTTYGYDALDRLTSAVTTQGSSTLFKRSYGYDEIGNIIAVGRWPNPPAPYRNYGSMGSASLASTGSRGRITGITGLGSSSGAITGGSAAPFTLGGSLGTGSAGTVLRSANSVASGSVSANGSRNSITAFTGGAARLAFTQASGAPTPVPEQAWAYTDYTYDPNHPHAVSALSTGETYTYDRNGNMTRRVEGGVIYTQTFDAENRLSAVITTTGGTLFTTTFNYDGDGNLVRRIRPDQTATVYVGGSFEVELKANGVTTSAYTSYYNALTARVMRVVTDTLANSHVYYILTDQLGSASVTLNSTGGVVGEMRYYAFGETRLVTGSMYTDKLYTGQRADSYIKLIQMGARWYDQALGRFISADSIVPQPGNPQSLNRYSYAINNPLRYTDPTGHDYLCDAKCEEKLDKKWSPPAKPTKRSTGSLPAVSVPGNDENDNHPVATDKPDGKAGAKEKVTQVLTAGGVIMDGIALGINGTYSFVADVATFFDPPSYLLFEAAYQPYSVLANLASTAAFGFWYAVGTTTGENKISRNSGPEGITISLSVSQDSAVSAATTLAGWGVRDFNVATILDGAVLDYDGLRLINPLDPRSGKPFLPTLINPNFSITYDPATGRINSKASWAP